MVAIVIDRPSNGAARLAASCGLVRVRPNRVPNTRHRTLINWGCSTIPVNQRQVVLNPPNAVSSAIDKVRSLELVGEFAPRFWTRAEDVQRARGDIILCRRNFLSEGRGITVVRSKDQLVPADFYVKYVPKIEEFRLHVFNGRVIAVQQKLRRNGAEQQGDQKLIRNHQNGWVFAVNNVNLENDERREALYLAATRSVESLGLDFAAVDMLIGRDDGRPYFLEANTRPGIESDTILNAYTQAISEINLPRRRRDVANH